MNLPLHRSNGLGFIPAIYAPGRSMPAPLQTPIWFSPEDLMQNTSAVEQREGKAGGASAEARRLAVLEARS